MTTPHSKTVIHRQRPARAPRAPKWSLLEPRGQPVANDTAQSRVARLARYGATLLALALVTALLYPLREIAGLLNMGLLFLIVVVGAAVFAGQKAAILAAILGPLLLDYFLIPPYLTFAIGDLHNILAWFVFLGFALLISWLITSARQQAEQARRRAEDVTRLYELAQTLVGAPDADEALAAIAGKVVAVFGAGACWLLLPGHQQQLELKAAAPTTARPISRDEMSIAAWAFWHGSEAGLPAAPQAERIAAAPGRAAVAQRVVFIPMHSGGKTVGVLGVADKQNNHPFADSEQIVLATYADQAAAILDRFALLKEAQRAELLARTDELKSALLSAVSHDLRTPLASIMAMVTGLLDRGIEWDDAGRREFLEGIYDEVRRLNRLVGNLLDMSRIEGGALHPQKEWYSIREVLAAVAQRLQPQLSQTGHPLELDLASDLPATLLDFTEIDQVLSNLVENAIKYTPAGTPISIRAQQAGNNIEVTVADRGPGVAPEHLPHLFERFYRVDSDRRGGKRGTGLGLAIARGLVEAHGGRIIAASRPGHGLSITFTLPITPAEPQLAPVAGDNALP